MPSTKKTDVVCVGQNGTEEHSRRVEVKSTPEKGSPPQGSWNGVGGMGWEGGLGGGMLWKPC